MTEPYDYKPPFGFDIRIKPDTESAPEPEAERPCQRPGCRATAACRVRAAPDRMHEYRWLCQQHAREHNQSWDYFRGKTDEEIAAFQESALTGHRPTWGVGVNKWGRNGPSVPPGFKPGQDRPKRDHLNGSGPMGDPFDLFEQAEGFRSEHAREPRRHLSRLQRGALDDLGLDERAGLQDVKARYKELVKRFHPDANGGDRGAEDSLRRVIRAYQLLKSSGFK